MKRARTIAVASTLIALAAVAVGYGTGTAGRPAPTADPTGSDQATLMAAHQGGTLKLLAKAAGGTIDPHVNYTLQYWQLYQATYDGLLGFEKAGGNAAFTVVPDLATAVPTPTNGGTTNQNVSNCFATIAERFSDWAMRITPITESDSATAAKTPISHMVKRDCEV